ncbi:MAG TPA: lytic murein transglycosylase B [Halomonas sp.]|nr:lytic murein transglycosylase B [Halomonas sp.]
MMGLQQGRSRALLIGALLGGLLVSSRAPAVDFDPARGEVKTLVDEVAAAGVSREWLNAAMQRADFSREVLDAMTGAAEHRLVWHSYRDIFLGEERIREGAAFIEAHRPAFERAERVYGVPPEIIAAILGVETRYGQIKGRHRVLDSLSTLAFHHPRRGSFFRGELKAFLEIAWEQRMAPDELVGSYAGAMGYPQFIPTSYRAYAVDFNGDGKRNLWSDPEDAIGSIGNYFAEHRWQAGAPIYHEARGPAEPPEGVDFNQAKAPYASVGSLAQRGITAAAALDAGTRVVPLALELADGSSQYRLGRDNFYVITRYNHSYLYAMAVTELAEAIAAAREAGFVQAVQTEAAS